jgi:ADP-dependent NAD(P)H-hydrate dehydratase / NAD(P)H-hydrate epimerase
MGYLLTNNEMAEAERLTIEAGGASALLMEKAGAGIAARLIETVDLPEDGGIRVLIMCGPGNNGGDGFVIARYLQEAGWRVDVAVLKALDDLKGDAAAAARKWDGTVSSLSDGGIADHDIIIDALFGTGLSRVVDGEAAEAISVANAAGVLRVAVDIPSGISGDSGRIVGGEGAAVFDAHLTITFFAKKRGHMLLPGRHFAGDIAVIPIGISNDVLDEIRPPVQENRPEIWVNHLGSGNPYGHKYDRGHVLVCGGPSATSGAARLAALSALRTGAGLVTTAFPAEALSVYAANQLAVMNGPYDTIEDFRALLDSQKRNAVLIGPGHGVNDTTARMVLEILATEKATVLDADAISAFANSPTGLFEAIKGETVLTPHSGEFLRLFPDIDPKADKIAAAQEAAARSGAVVLLKGPDTVIADPVGNAVVNDHAPATLATAGSGDILSGIIIALMAQGVPAFKAACAAAWLHGECAYQIDRPLIAEDLIDAIPTALMVAIQQ